MPHGSDSSKVFVNSKVISRLDKIEADLIRQSKETGKITTTVTESVTALAFQKSLIQEQNEDCQKLCVAFQDSIAKTSDSSKSLETSYKEAFLDLEASLKETQIELCTKIDFLSKSFFDRIETVEARHNQLCAKVTSLKNLMCASKVEEDSRSDVLSSASESGMFPPSHTSEAESSIPATVNLASKFCNISDPDVSLTPDDAQQSSVF